MLEARSSFIVLTIEVIRIFVWVKVFGNVCPTLISTFLFIFYAYSDEKQIFDKGIQIIMMFVKVVWDNL